MSAARETPDALKGTLRTSALLVGRGMPAVVLRVVILLVGAVIVLVPWREGAGVGTLVVLLPAVIASVYAPASPAPAGVVVSAAVLVTLSGGDPLRAEVLMLVPLVHLFHITCGLAGVVPVSGRVHLSALRAPVLRFVSVQAVMAVLIGLAAVLPTTRTHPLVEALGLAGLAGVAVLVIWLQRVK
ncbi:hypothetical protein [Actinophytocola sp.]|uniref:hypothetical protein n=1 Tax=Actinophytocola sp. TaxID=1872138 RepID=UPI002ED2B905